MNHDATDHWYQSFACDDTMDIYKKDRCKIIKIVRLLTIDNSKLEYIQSNRCEVY